tara:strand:- start:541 stop:858 length:318 start_codon:yes stop_codon:yes gene_type:complete
LSTLASLPLLLLQSGNLLLFLLLALLNEHVVASVCLSRDVPALHVLSPPLLVDDIACLRISQLADLVLLLVLVRLLALTGWSLVWAVAFVVGVVNILLVNLLGQI